MIHRISKTPTVAQVDTRIAAGNRGGWTPHTSVTVASMSLATVGRLMMYAWKE